MDIEWRNTNGQNMFCYNGIWNQKQFKFRFNL